MATVTFDHVWKKYGEVVAVNDLNLEIQDGEFMVLVGPSGCGKTTSLRMIAGLEEISQGTMRIGERVVNDLAPKDRDVAMVFQSYALYPHMTVRDNLAFGLRLAPPSSPTCSIASPSSSPAASDSASRSDEPSSANRPYS
jgi:multiple sugar transport system ATP-binding protein